MILGDLTDQTRNDNSVVEIVVEQTTHSFNNEWLVKSFSECSLLFLLEVARGRSFTSSDVFQAQRPTKARFKDSAAEDNPGMATPLLLKQQRTGAGLNRLDCCDGGGFATDRIHQHWYERS